MLTHNENSAGQHQKFRMNKKLDSLLDQMNDLERQMRQELQREEANFFYEVRTNKVRFTDEANVRNKKLSKGIFRYIADSPYMVLLTTPVIWACIVPIALVDLVLSIYQAICFPIYRIPKVHRADYILLDRGRLSYLNFIEKLNCQYCAYANGVLACATEVAGRTEQYWCPIKHALRMKSMHSRYRFFFDYGDAAHYRGEIEKLRRSFQDVD